MYSNISVHYCLVYERNQTLWLIVGEIASKLSISTRFSAMFNVWTPAHTLTFAGSTDHVWYVLPDPILNPERYWHRVSVEFQSSCNGDTYSAGLLWHYADGRLVTDEATASMARWSARLWLCLMARDGPSDRWQLWLPVGWLRCRLSPNSCSFCLPVRPSVNIRLANVCTERGWKSNNVSSKSIILQGKNWAGIWKVEVRNSGFWQL